MKELLPPSVAVHEVADPVEDAGDVSEEELGFEGAADAPGSELLCSIRSKQAPCPSKVAKVVEHMLTTFAPTSCVCKVRGQLAERFR